MESEQKGEKRLAGFCFNLLLFSAFASAPARFSKFDFPLAKQVVPVGYHAKTKWRSKDRHKNVILVVANRGKKHA